MEYVNNPQLQLAYDFLQYTNRNVFLTGKAGTGKTTFLTRLKQSCPKRMVVLAPTGVAAINAGGVTIHSFFQLPFGPFLPGFVQNEGGKVKYNFNKRKIDIIRTLDLLVIDEISMVRADLLDAIDDVLRRYRGNQNPFGGVQLLMIGDLHQLAPVVKDDEWELLKQHYQSMYFFGSNALQRTDYITIELKQIFRQASQHFVDLLNKVREGNADNSVFSELNKRYQSGFEPKDKDGFITLTTHNYQSNEINQAKLKNINSKLVKYTAVVEGNFPEQMYPTEFELELKEGAQVMFVKNDVSPEKRYYNGKIGRIVNIEDDVVYVNCADNEDIVEVRPEIWNNASYKIDNQTKEIVETIDGTFKQYPLKLAWAITIHKSQGLTFDKVVIDAAQAFSHGQVYVALSRCKTLEGIVLNSRLGEDCLIGDEQVSRFNSAVEQMVVDGNTLRESKLKYEQELIGDLFNCTAIYYEMQHCSRLFNKYGTVLLGNYSEKVAPFLPRFNTEVLSVSKSFENQVSQIINTGVKDNKFLQERIGKGCAYFASKLEELTVAPFGSITIATDNSEIETETEDALRKLLDLVSQKRYCLDAMKDSFSIQEYLQVRAKSLLQKEKAKKESSKSTAKAKPEVDEDIVENAKLFGQLRVWRNELAKENNVPAYVVLSQKAIVGIANLLPDSMDALLNVKGIGKDKARKYGQQIIDFVRQYKRENGIKFEDTSTTLFDISVAEKKPVPKKSKKAEEPDIEDKPEREDTKEVTMQLFMDGMSVEQIASFRKLSVSTIVNHLCHYIKEGSIDPTDILDPDKVEVMADYFQSNTSGQQTLSSARQALGDDYSYDELKMVLCWIESGGM